MNMSKKRFMLMFIIILFANSAFAQDAAEQSNWTANFGLSFLFPLSSKSSPGVNVAESIVFSSVAIGAGYHLRLVPNVLMPGIYGDIHMTLLTIITSSCINNNNDNVINGDDNSNIPSLFQGGISLYNLFRFGSLDIQPSAGFNFAAGLIKPSIFVKYGILAALGNTGVEYSYQRALTSNIKNDIPYLHRLVFVLHMR